MTIPYAVIEIFTSEEIRHEGAPLSRRIVEYVRGRKVAARCLVTRAVSGCFETGEIATHGVEVLSFNMPLKIEIILPMAELDRMLPDIQSMVTDGIVVVEDMRMVSHRTRSRLIPRQLRVLDAMTPAPKVAHTDTPVSELVKTMLHARFNGIPVVDAAGCPVGIVTQGDLIRRAGLPIRKQLLAEFESHHVDDYIASLAQRKVSEIMTRPVVTIEEDQPVAAAVDLMLKRDLKRLPVVNASGKLTGMFSRLDVFHIVQHETPPSASLKRHHVELENFRCARDIMETDTPVVLPQAPVAEVIGLVDTTDSQRVAVVDEQGVFQGLISDKMLLQAFSGQQSGLWRYLLTLPFMEIGKHKRDLIGAVHARTAADVMNRQVVTVQEQTPIDEAIRIMAEKGIKRLPVLDAQGKFCGLVSRDSVLRLGVSRE